MPRLHRGLEIHDDDLQQLPVFITPPSDAPEKTRSCDYLSKWCRENKDLISKLLRTFGAVKFRGFHVDEPKKFEQVVKAYENKLSNEYLGTAPRSVQPGTESVFSAAEFPSFIPIAQHIEMSFLPYPPQRLFLYCDTEPKEFGETSLCDFRKVWNELDENLKQKLTQKGILNVRYYHKESKWYHFDPTKLKGWEDVFLTSDKSKVEQECQKSRQETTWKGDDLRVVTRGGPTRTHPETGDVAWSNHLLVFHPCMFGQESWYIFKRTHRIIDLLKFFIGVVFCWLYMLLINPLDYGMNTLYGDGSSITLSEYSHIREVTWRNMVCPKWSKGDIVFVDNRIISHGRQPSAPPRKILVAWSSASQDPSPFPGDDVNVAGKFDSDFKRI